MDNPVTDGDGVDLLCFAQPRAAACNRGWPGTFFILFRAIGLVESGHLFHQAFFGTQPRPV